MERTGLHPELEMRLTDLELSIGRLRRKMALARGLERIELSAEIELLEQRCERLKERVRNLDREGPGRWSDIKAEILKVSDDLWGPVEDFANWIDREYAIDH